jgi:hypothetical protein
MTEIDKEKLNEKEVNPSEESFSRNSAGEFAKGAMEDFQDLQGKISENAGEIVGSEKKRVQEEIEEINKEADDAKQTFDTQMENSNNETSDEKEPSEVSTRIEELRDSLGYTDNKEIIAEFEEWANKPEEKKKEDIDNTTKKFKEYLGIEEEKDIREKQENIVKEIGSMEESLLEFSKQFSLSGNFEKVSKKNLKSIATQSRSFADWLRCEYLVETNQGDESMKKLLDQEHFDIVKSIELLEELAGIIEEGLEVGIENLPEDKKNRLLKYIIPAVLLSLAGIVGISAKIADMLLVGTKGKVAMGTIAGLGALKWAGAGAVAGKMAPWGLLVLLGGLISVEKIEKITGVKAPGWLKKVEKNNK